MSPTVEKRLKEITIDPKTVKLKIKSKTSSNSKSPANLSGEWKMTADAGGQIVNISVGIEQQGAKFKGTVSTPYGDGTIENGKIEGNNFTGTVNIDFQGSPLEILMEGSVENGEMKGSMSGSGIPPIAFTAERVN